MVPWFHNPFKDLASSKKYPALSGKIINQGEGS
jgi:hypothetical protein